MKSLCPALIGGVALAFGVAQAMGLQVASTSSQVVQFDFKATVQADGTVSDIEPDAALPEAFQAMIRRNVATWRYKPAQWQGKSYSMPVAQTIRAQVVPTEQGGLALRITEVTGPVKRVGFGERTRMEGVPMPPPRFPPELQQRGATTAIVYSVLYDEVGKARQIDLVYPSELDSNHQLWDASSREAMAQWVLPHMLEGVPISCRSNVPMIYQAASAPERARIPPEVAAFFDKYTDMCPMVRLETSVAGRLL